MKYLTIKKSLVAAFIAFTLGYASLSSAHSAGAPTGESRTFTGLAQITCFNDGNGDADNLIARIRDNSEPVPGLMVNLQLYKGNKAVSISDTVSGDADFTDFVTLQGGPGTYYLIVNKTDVGVRDFDIDWHCQTATGVHTGTDISVKQFE